jgi:hypothetical protein
MGDNLFLADRQQDSPARAVVVHDGAVVILQPELTLTCLRQTRRTASLRVAALEIVHMANL